LYRYDAGNIHEIRGYNRLARAARGEMIVLLQDDDVLKPDHSWYIIAAALFAKDTKLGLLGGYSGEIHAGPDMGRFTRGGSGYTDPR
jgi:hypothetical protein